MLNKYQLCQCGSTSSNNCFRCSACASASTPRRQHEWKHALKTWVILWCQNERVKHIVPCLYGKTVSNAQDGIVLCSRFSENSVMSFTNGSFLICENYHAELVPNRFSNRVLFAHIFLGDIQCPHSSLNVAASKHEFNTVHCLVNPVIAVKNICWPTIIDRYQQQLLFILKYRELFTVSK